MKKVIKIKERSLCVEYASKEMIRKLIFNEKVNEIS